MSLKIIEIDINIQTNLKIILIRFSKDKLRKVLIESCKNSSFKICVLLNKLKKIDQKYEN